MDSLLATNILLAPKEEVRKADSVLADLQSSSDPRKQELGSALRDEFTKAALKILEEKETVESAKEKLSKSSKE